MLPRIPLLFRPIRCVLIPICVVDVIAPKIILWDKLFTWGPPISHCCVVYES